MASFRPPSPGKFKERHLNKVPGNFEDHVIRKFIATKEGTIEHVPANDNDILNKKFFDDNTYWDRTTGAVNILTPKASTDNVELGGYLSRGSGRVAQSFYWNGSQPTFVNGHLLLTKTTGSLDSTQIQLRDRNAKLFTLLKLGVDHDAALWNNDSAGGFRFNANNDFIDYLRIATESNLVKLQVKGGSGLFIESEDNSNVGIFVFNDATHHVYLNYAKTTDIASLVAANASLEIHSTSTISFFPNADFDDYVQLSTTAHQTKFNFVGQNGLITADSGTIFFDDENLSTTGALAAGSGKFGAGANYTQWAADGTQTMNGTARVEKELQLQANNFSPGASGANAVFLGCYPGWQFPMDGDLVAEFEIPDDWDSTEPLHIRVYWYCDEDFALANGEVQWQIEWAACPADETELLDAPTHTGTIDYGNQEIPTNAKELTRTAEGVIASASLAAGDLIGICLSRINTDGGDPDPGMDPVMVHLEVEYVANKLGE